LSRRAHAEVEPQVAAAPPYRFTLVSAAVTCALAPAYTIRWHIGFYPTQLLEVALLVTLVIFAVEAIVERRAIELRSPHTMAAGLLLVAGLLSAAVAPDHRAALGLYRAYFIEPILFFVVLANTVRTVQRAALIAGGLGVAGLIVAIPNAAVVIDAMRHHTLDLVTTPPVVIFQTANAVALLLVPLIGLALSLLVYGDSPRERVLSATFLVVAVPATILSFSRGGYLALGVVAVVLALTHRRAKLFVPAVVALGLVLALLPPIRHRISYELHSVQGNTLEWRLQLWGQTLKMMRSHLVFGIGLSNYDHAMGPYWLNLSRVIYPHNILLNFWTVMGLLGLVAFTWVVVAALLGAWRGWRAGGAWRAIHLGVFLALLAVVIHGLVDVPYFKNDLSLEFWALVGLTWAGTRWGKPTPWPKPPQGAPLYRGARAPTG
jgi:hypothetical protein